MHDEVALATAGAAGAAAVAGTAMVEVATAGPVVVLAVIQVDPKGAVEATTAPVAVGVAAAEVVVMHPRPLLALQAESRVHHEEARFHAQVR